jgi:DNA-binding HxlR family transcriptional regulator
MLIPVEQVPPIAYDTYQIDTMISRKSANIAADIPGKHCCPATETLRVISGRWKVPIVWVLFKGTLRFSELRREMLPVTPKMLAQQLRELEKDGIVLRRVYPEVPPKVEYSLTATGRSLQPVVKAMCKWGKRR